jgi:hypothetical protein
MKQVSGHGRRAPGRSDALPDLEPMLARPGAVPRDDGWSLQVKFDGMRAQLRWDGRPIRLRSRPGRGCTSEPPPLTRRPALCLHAARVGTHLAPILHHLPAIAAAPANSDPGAQNPPGVYFSPWGAPAWR